MERNIAALMREDTRTVHVSFGAVNIRWNDELAEILLAESMPGKPYTYVTDLPLRPGDVIVVTASGHMKLAAVLAVDEGLKIEPGDTIKYSWVICKIDLTAYNANAERNAEIERVVADAYRTNLRRSFSQQILSGLDDARAAEVRQLLKPEAAGDA